MTDARSDAAEQTTRFTEQLEVSKIAADAALESNNAYKRAERPWIGLLMPIHALGNGPIDGGEVRTVYMFNFVLANAGRSPAVDARSFVDHRIQGNDEDIPHFELGAHDGPERVYTVLPGSKITTPRRIVEEADIQRLFERQARLFIWCRVEYADVFNPEIVRESEYCLEVTFFGNQRTPAGGYEPHFEYAPIGLQNFSR